MDKPVAPGWQAELLRRGKLQLLTLTGSIRGELWLWARVHPTHPPNFTVGLRYVDLAGQDLRLMRCNGRHPGPHPNVLGPPRTIPPMIQHIHYTTQAYIDDMARRRPRARQPDGHAIATALYDDVHGAIEVLARKCNIFEPQGVMSLADPTRHLP